MFVSFLIDMGAENGDCVSRGKWYVSRVELQGTNWLSPNKPEIQAGVLFNAERSPRELHLYHWGVKGQRPSIPGADQASSSPLDW